jgi:hypothetical protein
MPIANIYEPEKTIITALEGIFPTGQVYSESKLEEVTNESFLGIQNNADKVIALVVNAGFKADPPVVNNRSPQQLIKGFWQIVVVCPTELYYSVGGVKVVEVIKLFSGFHLEGMGKMTLVDDERGFNRPDWLNDMVYMPLMFNINIVV